MDNNKGINFSFILPAYKGRYLKEAINSILAQTYPYFELIIVNDKSPDDIDSIVNAFEDNRVSYYVNKENIGGKDLVAQWNHCLSFAKNEYVILATDDDLYEKIGGVFMERIEEMFEFDDEDEDDCGCGDEDCHCHDHNIR